MEHRLTPPKSPQTIGIVMRFNGGISHLLKTDRFDNALYLKQILMRYIQLYNTRLPQSSSESRKPKQAMEALDKSHLHLFVKSPRNHLGHDIYSISLWILRARRDPSYPLRNRAEKGWRFRATVAAVNKRNPDETSQRTFRYCVGAFEKINALGPQSSGRSKHILNLETQMGPTNFGIAPRPCGTALAALLKKLNIGTVATAQENQIFDPRMWWSSKFPRHERVAYVKWASMKNLYRAKHRLEEKRWHR